MVFDFIYCYLESSVLFNFLHLRWMWNSTQAYRFIYFKPHEILLLYIISVHRYLLTYLAFPLLFFIPSYFPCFHLELFSFCLKNTLQFQYFFLCSISNELFPILLPFFFLLVSKCLNFLRFGGIFLLGISNQLTIIFLILDSHFLCWQVSSWSN